MTTAGSLNGPARGFVGAVRVAMETDVLIGNAALACTGGAAVSCAGVGAAVAETVGDTTAVVVAVGAVAVPGIVGDAGDVVAMFVHAVVVD